MLGIFVCTNPVHASATHGYEPFESWEGTGHRTSDAFAAEKVQNAMSIQRLLGNTPAEQTFAPHNSNPSHVLRDRQGEQDLNPPKCVHGVRNFYSLNHLRLPQGDTAGLVSNAIYLREGDVFCRLAFLTQSRDKKIEYYGRAAYLYSVASTIDACLPAGTYTHAGRVSLNLATLVQDSAQKLEHYKWATYYYLKALEKDPHFPAQIYEDAGTSFLYLADLTQDNALKVGYYARAAHFYQVAFDRSPHFLPHIYRNAGGSFFNFSQLIQDVSAKRAALEKAIPFFKKAHDNGCDTHDLLKEAYALLAHTY